GLRIGCGAGGGAGGGVRGTQERCRVVGAHIRIDTGGGAVDAVDGEDAGELSGDERSARDRGGVVGAGEGDRRGGGGGAGFGGRPRAARRFDGHGGVARRVATGAARCDRPRRVAP